MTDQHAVIKGLWKIVEDYNRQNFHLQELLFFTLRNNALIFPMSMKSTFDNLNLKTKDIGSYQPNQVGPKKRGRKPKPRSGLLYVHEDPRQESAAEKIILEEMKQMRNLVGNVKPAEPEIKEKEALTYPPPLCLECKLEFENYEAAELHYKRFHKYANKK